MLFNNTVIESHSYFLPEKILSSEEIESRLSPTYDRLKLPYGRLELMTGIKNRRYWEKGTKSSEISTHAAKQAILNSTLDAKDIDLLIHCSVCKDSLEPATACVVHHNLGLKEHCLVYDLSNACLGFLNAIITAAQMIEQKSIQTALIVSGENSGPLLMETIDTINANKYITRKNIKKFIANLTIGSGAVAFILTHKENSPKKIKVLGANYGINSKYHDLCQGDGSPHSLTMETNSEELLKQGIALARDTWKKAKSTFSWDNTSPSWFVPHQVGKAHQEQLIKTLGLKESKVFSTFSHLGNTGSAALPISLIKLFEKHKPPIGANIALLGIGSGINSIMISLQV